MARKLNTNAQKKALIGTSLSRRKVSTPPLLSQARLWAKEKGEAEIKPARHIPKKPVEERPQTVELDRGKKKYHVVLVGCI